MIVAIDPGARCGAIVAVNARNEGVLAASWKSVTRAGSRAWVVDVVGLDPIGEVASLHVVGMAVRRAILDPYRLVVEGLFGRGPTLESLAYHAGIVSGPLDADADGSTVRPMASTWRSVVLGTTGDDAPARAIALAQRHRRTLGALVDSEHVAEALAMAEYCRRCG